MFFWRFCVLVGAHFFDWMPTHSFLCALIRHPLHFSFFEASLTPIITKTALPTVYHTTSIPYSRRTLLTRLSYYGPTNVHRSSHFVTIAHHTTINSPASTITPCVKPGLDHDSPSSSPTKFDPSSSPSPSVRSPAPTSPYGSLTALAEADEKRLDVYRCQGKELYPGGPVDRYLAPRNPFALLVEPYKLTKEERAFQYLFAVLPVLSFLLLAFFPVYLATWLLPQRKRIAEQRSGEISTFVVALNHRRPLRLVAGVEGVKSLLGGETRPSLLFSYRPGSFLGDLYLPLVCDIDRLLEKYNILVSVAVLLDDVSASCSLQSPTSSPVSSSAAAKDESQSEERTISAVSLASSPFPNSPSVSSMSRSFNSSCSTSSHPSQGSPLLGLYESIALSPFLHLLIPFAMSDGETGVLEISSRVPLDEGASTSLPHMGMGDGVTATRILADIANITPVSKQAMVEGQELNEALADLVEHLFATFFCGCRAVPDRRQYEQVAKESGIQGVLQLVKS